MKELSIEEKAKRYDEVIERAIKHRNNDGLTLEQYETIDIIFPELKDSEDEKWIPKEIAKYLKEKGDFRSCWLAWLEKQDENNGLPLTDRETLDAYAYQVAYDLSNDWLKVTPTWDDVEAAVKLGAKWLKKQGKQKSFNDTQEYLKGVNRVQNYEGLTKFEKSFDRIADTYAHNKNKEGYNSPWYTKERAAEMLHWAKEELGLIEKQGEQKSTEWSEEDENFFNRCIINIQMVDSDNTLVDWLKRLKDKVQLKQEWSEKYIADVFEKVGLAKIVREQSNDNLTNALQDAMIELSKFTPQSKQEWSKEDIEMLNSAILFVEHSAFTTIGKGKNNVIAWLKNLRDRVKPQPRQEWKPSKEQMDALANALSLAKNCGEESAFDLTTLYEQLKKLKEL